MKRNQITLMLKNGNYLPGLTRPAYFDTIKEAREYAKVYLKKGTYRINNQ